MNAASVLSSLYLKAQSLAFSDYETQSQQQQAAASDTKTKANSSVTILPAPTFNTSRTAQISASSLAHLQPSASSTSFDNEGYSTPRVNKQDPQRKDTSSPSPMSFMGKRKRLVMDDVSPVMGSTPTRRKGSSDFLRKGQWTSTEEKLARLLIEGFEEGYLPVYTGIRLRGYLAVQLQCDPMRVSKKLCAGTIDGKPVPKNYGQKKFKLRKKTIWDCEEAECRVRELEIVTQAMWYEARMTKPEFLTLSTTRNVTKRRRTEDEEDSMSSPPTPARSRIPSSTPRGKKQKVFPIIYLNLSKKFKHYSYSSSSEPSSPSKDSDCEPVKLDGESLQAAYDLLTLCSPRGSSRKAKSKRKLCAKRKSANAISFKDEERLIKDEPVPVKDTAASELDAIIKLEEVPTASSIDIQSEVFIKDEPSSLA